MSGAAPAIAGPTDRVHFLDAQRRNRRASWRFSIFAVVAAILSGLPLSILLAPLLFGLVLLLAHVVDAIVPFPTEVWRVFEQAARVVPNAWAATRGDAVAIHWTWLMMALVLPGSVVMVAAWLRIRRLSREVGVGGTLRRLAARPPHRDVVEELQVANIVEEIAIAAGVPPPRVMLIDTEAINAAAVGLTIADATILVTRGFLDLDRDAKQAILAHVVGSVANGDLKIASIILSVLESWGLLALLIDTPFGPRSRTALRQFLATSREARRNQAGRDRTARALDRLLDGAGMTFDDLFEHTDVTHSRPVGRALLIDLPLYLTLGVGAIASKASIALFTLLVFGPWIALLWRARRHLADAVAVQLTRHPDALARAVRELEGRNVAVEGGAAVSFLFPFWTRWSPDEPPREDIMAHVVGTQLDLDKRLNAIRRLGASQGNQAATTQSPAVPIEEKHAGSLKEIATFLGWGVLALLLVGACIAFTLLTMSLLLWAVWSGFQAVFRVF